MLGIRVAVGLFGVFDMFFFGGVIIRSCFVWNILPKHSEHYENLLMAIILIAAIWMIAAVGLLRTSYSKSHIDAQKYCLPWLCFSYTTVCLGTPLTYFLLSIFDNNTFNILFLTCLFFRIIATTVVVQFLKTLGCELFINNPDRASMAESRVPQTTLFV